MSSEQQERPRLTYLGTIADALALIDLVNRTRFSYGCTWVRGPTHCARRSPPVVEHQDMRDVAIAAGWRIWGPGDTELFTGEVLCPDHTLDCMAAAIAAYRLAGRR